MHPASLYFGKVMHARLKPIGHRFTYRVASLLIDIDRLDEAGRSTALLKVNRPALFSFYEKDHGPRDGTSLRRHVDKLLADRAISIIPRGRVLLLAYPRMAGYVFNPLSIYFCYAAGGEVAALIYEVRNTFGEMHTYVCAVDPLQRASGMVRQSQRKAFYVSPFIDMDAIYHFRMWPAAESLKFRILETDAEGPLFAAAFSGRRMPFSNASLALAALLFPLMTFKVVAAIHFEALRLWLKGVRLVKRPQPA